VRLVERLKWVRMKGPTTQFRGYDVRRVATLQEDGFFIVGNKLYIVLVNAEGSTDGRWDALQSRIKDIKRRSTLKPFITPRLMRTETLGLSGDPSGPIPNKECDGRDGLTTRKRVRRRMGSAASEAR